MMVANLLRPSWLAAATFGLFGLMSPGGGAVPPPPPTVAPPPTKAFLAAKGDDGLFYLTARVNGVPIRFVVDTGANVVVLTDDDARRAGIRPGNGTQRMETASGGSEMRWATLDELEIAGQRLPRTRAAVVAEGLNMSLLGQNALAQLNSVTLTGNRLEIR